MMMDNLIMRPLALAVLLASVSGCSLKTIAMRSLANAVAEPGGVYAEDDDPELVKDSLPVMLKIMEQLASGLPDHKGIREALARGFTSYSVAFVEDEGDRLNESAVDKARAVYLRSRKLSLRAYKYGLQGLEISVPGFTKAFTGSSREERARVLALVKKEDCGLLYWTGAALGSAISVSKDDMKLVGELPLVEALMKRGLELDESYDEGAFHEFFITWSMQPSAGGAKAAKQHFDRALALSHNKKLGAYVTYAEAVDVDQQNKKEFVALLEKVLAYDVDSDAPHRLVNVIAQQRAKWLLSRTSDLFAD
jgi:predicted anti-sigma-YlaC factor YlaD